MWCSSWPVPVAIVAAHTGVTLGNAATQSSTYVPRAMIVCSVGARPVATARSSIAGFRPSMTARTSFTWGSCARSSQDAEPRVLLLGAAAVADEQPGQEAQDDDCQRGEQDRGAGGAERG